MTLKDILLKVIKEPSAKGHYEVVAHLLKDIKGHSDKGHFEVVALLLKDRTKMVIT